MRVALALTSALCLPLIAWAGSAVSPVLVELPHARAVATVRFTNDAAHPIRVQAATLRWRQIDGANEEKATDELIVVPAIAEVAARATQVFRVALRRPDPSNVERTYRLVLQELPSQAQRADGVAVQTPLSHDLPVSVAPASAIVRRVGWAPCTEAQSAKRSMPPGAMCLHVSNEGNRRLRIGSLTLTAGDETRTVDLNPSELLLAGAAKALRVSADWPGKSLQRTVTLRDPAGELIEASALRRDVASGP
jgi:fimbrial chaperone protein